MKCSSISILVIACQDYDLNNAQEKNKLSALEKVKQVHESHSSYGPSRPSVTRHDIMLSVGIKLVLAPEVAKEML